MPVQNQFDGSASMPTFPPPPMSATLQREQTKRKSVPKSKTKTKSTEPGYTSLQKSRFFLLPMVLVLSFIVLILGVIYAYCVASPHTMLSDAQLASPEDIEIDSSIFARRYVIPLPPIDGASTNFKREPLPVPGTEEDASITEAIAEAVNSTSEDATRAREESHPSNKSSLSLSLAFYTIASPLYNILLVSIELGMALSSPAAAPSSPIVAQTIAPRPWYHLSGSLHSWRAHMILLIMTMLNIASLTTTTSLWVHCEIPSPAITTNRRVCPAELRGHWMGGIHEVSIAKVTISWLVVLALCWHSLLVLKNMKTERRRWALNQHHVPAEEVDVIVKMDEADLEKGHKESSRVRFLR